MPTNVDVLNLEYRSFPSRDTEKAAIVCNYLRMQGASVVEGCVFNGYSLLLKYRPQLLLITGIAGADINVAVARFAKWLGCKVISLTGEGGYRTELTEKDVLGWLPRDDYFLDYWLQWSQNDTNFMLKLCPEFKESYKIVGSIGHDRYFFPGIGTRLPVDPNYKKIIGIGGWVWPDSCAENPQADTTCVEKFFEHERDLYSRLLQDIIQKNPDIFFLLKEHPGSPSLFSSGMERCAGLKNVLITKHTPIIDCLVTCDAWFSVESNTSLEAWLLNKPTASINPSGITWPISRNKFHLFQPNYPDITSLQNALDQLATTNTLPDFDVNADGRQALIKEIVEHTDGLNHVRAGNVILEALAAPPRARSRSRLKDHAKRCFNNIMHWNFSRYHRLLPKRIPYFKQFEEFWKERSLWDQAERDNLSALRLRQQKQFYADRGLTLEALRTLR